MIQIAFVMIHWFHLFSEGTAVNCDKLGDGKRFNKMTEGEAKGGGGQVDTNVERGASTQDG